MLYTLLFLLFFTFLLFLLYSSQFDDDIRIGRLFNKQLKLYKAYDFVLAGELIIIRLTLRIAHSLMLFHNFIMHIKNVIHEQYIYGKNIYYERIVLNKFIHVIYFFIQQNN